ncbi:unnamed protein product [Acanthosepion pharaonis]|uniref:Uncharacterized protein n=1 Tax=Acanthosepion pharaonis TaxID=158019 RepID=A0A812DVE3_ACAPH|nr:unnamed protein product [Sepia pharaonis]
MPNGATAPGERMSLSARADKGIDFVHRGALCPKRWRKHRRDGIIHASSSAPLYWLYGAIFPIRAVLPRPSGDRAMAISGSFTIKRPPQCHSSRISGSCRPRGVLGPAIPADMDEVRPSEDLHRAEIFVAAAHEVQGHSKKPTKFAPRTDGHATDDHQRRGRRHKPRYAPSGERTDTRQTGGDTEAWNRSRCREVKNSRRLSIARSVASPSMRAGAGTAQSGCPAFRRSGRPVDPRRSCFRLPISEAPRRNARAMAI